MKMRLEPIPTPVQTTRSEASASQETNHQARRDAASMAVADEVVGTSQEAVTTPKTQTRKRRFLRRAGRAVEQVVKIGAPLLAVGLWAVGVHNMMTGLFLVFVSFCAALYFVANVAQTAFRAYALRGGARRRGTLRGMAKRLAAQACLFALVQFGLWSALRTAWPLRLTFAASQPALERLAARVENGETVTFPVRAGALKIYSVREYMPNVYLYHTEPGRDAGLIHDTNGTNPTPGIGDAAGPLAPHWLVWSDD